MALLHKTIVLNRLVVWHDLPTVIDTSRKRCQFGGQRRNVARAGRETIELEEDVLPEGKGKSPVHAGWVLLCDGGSVVARCITPHQGCGWLGNIRLLILIEDLGNLRVGV